MPTETEQILQTVADAQKLIKERAEAEKETQGQVKLLAEEQTRVAKALTDAQAGLREIQRQRSAAALEDGRFRVQDGRLAGFDPFDLRIIEGTLQGRHRNPNLPAYPRLETAVLEARKSLREGVTQEGVLRWQDAAVAAVKVSPKGTSRDGIEGFRRATAQWTRQMIGSIQKAMDSTTAGAGDELVPTLEDATVWMDVHLATLVLPLLPQITMPSNPYDMPIQFGDTNWYPTTENVQGLTTDLATQKVTLTAKGIKTGVPFSDELEEDAIIAFVPELRAQLVLNAAEVLDDVALNADQTAANGINSDGATITASTAGKGQWLLGFDGIVHAALVDNSSGQSVDIGGGLSAAAYNRLLVLLGKYAIPRRQGDVVYVVDVPCAIRSLAISEVETITNFGPRATISTGELMNLYGIPIVMSSQFRTADVDGKVTDSGNATANLGRILCFNTTQWRVGFKRGITVEPDREPGKSQTTLYVSMRVALTERSGTRTTQTHTSVGYNVILNTAPS